MTRHTGMPQNNMELRICTSLGKNLIKYGHDQTHRHAPEQHGVKNMHVTWQTFNLIWPWPLNIHSNKMNHFFPTRQENNVWVIFVFVVPIDTKAWLSQSDLRQVHAQPQYRTLDILFNFIVTALEFLTIFHSYSAEAIKLRSIFKIKILSLSMTALETLCESHAR